MSSPSHGHIEVALYDDIVYAKAVGLASMSNCTPLSDFAENALNEGYRKVIVDLRDCTGMDSTFMGILAGIAQYFPEDARDVMVVNANEHNTRLLEELGLTMLVKIKGEDVNIPEAITKRLDDPEYSDVERIKVVKEAHEHLVEINEKNHEQFGAVLKMLANELAQKGPDQHEAEEGSV